MTVDEFVGKVDRTHRRYDKVPHTFRMADTITVICTLHNTEFDVVAKNYVKTNGGGCAKCRSENIRSSRSVGYDVIVQRCIEKHSGKYTYSNKYNYKNTRSYISITCPEHGEFKQIVDSHLYGGSGCPKCGNAISACNINSYNDKHKISTDKFIKMSIGVHGDRYGYNKVKMASMHDHVSVVCKDHGEFSVLPHNHIYNQNGCPKCANDAKRLSSSEYIDKCIEKFGDRFQYDSTVYKSMLDPVDITCPVHGVFTVKCAGWFIYGNTKCPKCKSVSEVEVREYVEQFVDVIANDRTVLNGKELDIYVESSKIAFEYNGLYWHSYERVGKLYHVNKLDQCEAKGIRLINVFEDQWLYKKDIVKSRIKSILGVVSRVVYARKCSIKDVDNATYKEFMNTNHIQGYVPASIRYGLYVGDELVAMASFSRQRKSIMNGGSGYELLRFANVLDTRVIGGMSKLFKHFIRRVNPIEVISYADRNWSSQLGNVYESVGFSKVSVSLPGYHYFKRSERIRYHRSKYQKHMLVKRGADARLSESEIMIADGFHKIYDCGTIKYVWK